MLMWHRKLWLIDHGAALYFHHGWGTAPTAAGEPVPADQGSHPAEVRRRMLDEADAAMTARITPAAHRDVVALVPDAWLASDKAFASPALARAAYVQHLSRAAWQRRAHFSRRPSVHAHMLV